MIEQWVDQIEGDGLDEALGRCRMSTGNAAGTAPRKRKSETPFLPAKRPRKLETPAIATGRDARTTDGIKKAPAVTRAMFSRAATRTPTPARRQLVVEIPRRRPMRPT